MKKKRKNSRVKGARAELLAVKFLTSIGFPCRRTAQIRGKAGGCADIEFEDEKFPIHVEVKHVKGMDLNTILLAKAIDQAAREAKPGFSPVVLWRKNGSWNLTLYNASCPTVQQAEIGDTLLAIAREQGWGAAA